ncbi:MAG: serine dehydratase [Bacteroidetes bacterium GWF2_43_63]|nr:MAG: serine dehydratase [Bacteroidetes bacterium GWE2_42_42]OFY54348.1 MAG: serine dehydratase [Bacteroidetes bacterium GWF2_43_63]HBG69263.1 serine dehydratase [Bacteroidales bacterium]HCB61181.1 serine dehydratase [Bacteroidales bacterium]HCY24101.1 serine dehydratase [Bacteroidales bacterium]
MTIPDFCEKTALTEAAYRIKGYIHRTPLLSCSAIDRFHGCEIVFKCENFQVAGAFKSRGAANAVFSLIEKGFSGSVATHSSGNHAQALSRVALHAGIAAHVVMPENSLLSKINATKEYKAQVTFCQPMLAARETTLTKIIVDTGAVEIHPYDNREIIIGQATCAMEILDEYKPDFILTPVGGGGLLSGTALAAAYFGNSVKVIGAEPAGAADARESFVTKKFVPSVDPKTIADGLLTSLGKLTFPLILQHVNDILLADESEIISAMRMLWERAKIMAEPSSAVPLAVVKANPDIFRNKKVCIIISGGNADLDHLPWTN